MPPMQVDFTDACKDQLTRQQRKRVKDHRMDYDLRSGCKNDVPKVPINLVWHTRERGFPLGEAKLC